MGKGLHPRNRHTGRYDFAQLTRSSPALASFVSPSPRGEPTIDFADPIAVKALNRALLKHFYGVTSWDIPAGYLCPPIPGRADYLHHAADLLAFGYGGPSGLSGEVPRGNSVRVLDVGVGANCIYPLIGHSEYGWSFVGSDVDATALASAKKIVQENAGLSDAIELRLQPSRTHIFEGLVSENERFDLSLCNPPFHASLAEAQEGSQRKWKNLGAGKAGKQTQSQAPKLNFGGQETELWFPGGEVEFSRLMVEESVRYARNIFWFSTLISKESSLRSVRAALKKAGVLASQTIDMAQGQKKSRVVAWTFLDEKQRKAWRER